MVAIRSNLKWFDVPFAGTLMFDVELQCLLDWMDVDVATTAVRCNMHPEV